MYKQTEYLGKLVNGAKYQSMSPPYCLFIYLKRPRYNHYENLQIIIKMA